jgi:hypothetical protein
MKLYFAGTSISIPINASAVRPWVFHCHISMVDAGIPQAVVHGMLSMDGVSTQSASATVAATTGEVKLTMTSTAGGNITTYASYLEFIG